MPDASWFAPVDNDCERLDPGFWSEPLNALTNAAFLVAAGAAFLQWRRMGSRDRAGLWLIAVTAVVGIGSFLFHTVAERWAVFADVLPIAVFIFSYFFLAKHRFLRLGTGRALAATALFAALGVSFKPLWLGIAPGFSLNGSVGYLPAALALPTVGTLCVAKGAAAAGRGLLLAGAVFAASLALRSVDGALCAALPVGTHFVWHLSTRWCSGFS